VLILLTFFTSHFQGTSTSTFVFNPLTPGAFCKNRFFFDIMAVFRLDFGQISFNLVENAFATRQLAVLATSITFYDILARACAEIKIDLLLGLLSVKRLKGSIIETGNFYDGAARCCGREFCSEFFTELFEHFCAYLGLHSANHPDLGIIAKMFSSCRSGV